MAAGKSILSKELAEREDTVLLVLDDLANWTELNTTECIMASIHDVKFRVATTVDAPAMAQCQLSDPTAGRADPRMAAYFSGNHHPQQALLPRQGFVALSGDQVIAYIAGHRTHRHGCEGEVQYLFVAPAYRRRGVGSALLRLLADWFHEQAARKVCVAVANDSPPEAKPFIERLGAVPLKKHWYAWDDFGGVPRLTATVQPSTSLEPASGAKRRTTSKRRSRAARD